MNEWLVQLDDENKNNQKIENLEMQMKGKVFIDQFIKLYINRRLVKQITKNYYVVRKTNLREINFTTKMYLIESWRAATQQQNKKHHFAELQKWQNDWMARHICVLMQSAVCNAVWCNVTINLFFMFPFLGARVNS